MPAAVRGADFAALRRLHLALLDRADGNAAAAAEGVEDARRELQCSRCLRAELAATYQLLDRTDDAITTWRSMVEERSGPNTDAWEFPLALERLGELYDANGDRDDAIAFYSGFAELWKDADPDLRPRADRARTRAATLLAERG